MAAININKNERIGRIAKLLQRNAVIQKQDLKRVVARFLARLSFDDFDRLFGQGGTQELRRVEIRRLLPKLENALLKLAVEWLQDPVEAEFLKQLPNTKHPKMHLSPL